MFDITLYNNRKMHAKDIASNEIHNGKWLITELERHAVLFIGLVSIQHSREQPWMAVSSNVLQPETTLQS